jgi:hypothetical protein
MIYIFINEIVKSVEWSVFRKKRLSGNGYLIYKRKIIL